MTKKEYYEENYDKLLESAREELNDMVKLAMNMNDDDYIHLSEHNINPPIYLEADNDELKEVVYKAFIDDDGKVLFGIGNCVSDYDIGVDVMEMDMVLYLMGEFEYLIATIEK